MKALLRTLIIAAGLAVTGCVGDDAPAQPADGTTFGAGSGVVTYAGYAPLASRPIRIYYHIPAAGNMRTMPVLLVFPGIERNAADYLAAWKKAADRKHIMVFAFEFPADTYKSSQYIEGGMFSGNRLLERKDWTFAVVEAVFDKIKSDTGSGAVAYDMWGHSAGAQFVHRYVTFMPEARVNCAVAANAGWYTVPDMATEFPYGLKGTDMTVVWVNRLFGRKLWVQLGTADIGTGNLNTTPGANAQGATRYARGKYYFAEAQRISRENGVALAWSLDEVGGVGHDYVKMAEYAAGTLY